jgi:hypothetical protein
LNTVVSTKSLFLKLRFGAGCSPVSPPPLLDLPLLMITLFQHLQQTINSRYHISICTAMTMLRHVFPSVLSHFLLSVTKVKSFLCLIAHRDRKPCGVSGGENSALCPDCFTSGKRVPVPWMGGPLDPRADGGTQISFRHQKLNLHSSMVRPATLTTLSAAYVGRGIRPVFLSCPSPCTSISMSYKYRLMYSYVTK